MICSQHIEQPDVILIGSGIMSANLGALLKCLEPRLSIQVYEATNELAQESSNGWNNAGTGHAGLCELSYTPKREANGTVNVTKAIEIFEQFEQSKQFWGYAVSKGMIGNPSDFINSVPHLSFVQGGEQMEFLRARFAGMAAHHFFSGMTFSTDRAAIKEWAPLLVEGRNDLPIAATKIDRGTDVNFGALASQLMTWLSMQECCGVATAHRVVDLKKTGNGWFVTVRDLATNQVIRNHAKFIFVGAGGGSLALLQKSGIAESKGLGGFPIGGQWLACDTPDIVRKHHAKVYGHALQAAPTMAVPHLDSRVLSGKHTLLFGPFAAWTTRFLRHEGQMSDLLRSVKPDNFGTLIKIGVRNIELLRYLYQQGTQSMADRLEALRSFYPQARAEDWRLVDAGIRVQTIKKTDGEAGIIHYGTETVTSRDRSISALLGASPGASVSVSIALELIETCFRDLLQDRQVRSRLKAMIPTWKVDIKNRENISEFEKSHSEANNRLKLA